MILRITTVLFLLASSIYAQNRVPVLVELFTSEGCSSCPPADNLLAELESKQSIPNVDVIVLSEHVDYWDSLGWKDPFSAKTFSERQESYGRMLRSGEIYTPQAVIDGRYATVGSHRQDLIDALTKSGGKAKPELQISIKRDAGSLLVEFPAETKGDVWIAITQAKAVSQVARGENGGHTLQHVGVVRSLVKVKSKQARIAIDKDWPADLRVVAFVQDGHSGRILQAVQKAI